MRWNGNSMVGWNGRLQDHVTANLMDLRVVPSLAKVFHELVSAQVAR
jgi:hypothetical protein